MEIVGYFAASLIGLSLGLIGGGGSILTVPVLVYLFAVSDAEVATAYSLFIVGATAAVGAVNYGRNKLIDLRTGVVFAIPAIPAVYLTRSYLIPAIPDEIAQIGEWTLTKDAGMLILFGLLMLGTAYSMIKGRKDTDENESDPQRKISVAKVAIEGAVVGVLTGLVGAGGGFLIIPALVLIGKLPMKVAVGTSLFIIALKSLLGFLGDVQAGTPLDWGFLLVITAIAVVGIFIGFALSKLVSGAKLKPAFGWFVLAMGVFMVGQQFLQPAQADEENPSQAEVSQNP
ncbi:MAG: sulfite exporter TauE/SafE family protein [Fimbriimonadaceae bacterium]